MSNRAQSTFIVKQILLLVLALTGCGRVVEPPAQESGKWILDSYDANKGYVFRRDGVRYTTHCRTSYLYDVHSPATSESECSAVLPYLHKPLLLEQGPRGPDVQILRFTETHEGGTKGWHCEFEISEAK